MVRVILVMLKIDWKMIFPFGMAQFHPISGAMLVYPKDLGPSNGRV